MTTYELPMFERLVPLTPWTGGRVGDTDVLELAEAAAMASVHAGVGITIKDILRAAGRGEITLKAIIHHTVKVHGHDGGIYCNAGQENENIACAGAIPTLPLSACRHLAATGRASWRTFDGFEMRDGVLCHYTKGILAPGEPDFETVPDDCRVTGSTIHALADAFKVTDDAQSAPVKKIPTKRPTLWDVVTPYLIETLRAGQYATAKELYKALETNAGQNSPFDKGTGSNRYSLFAREVRESLALKTLQNNWQELLTKAAKK